MRCRALGLVTVSLVTIACLTIALWLLEEGAVSDGEAADLPRHSLDVTLHPDSLGVKVSELELGNCTFDGEVTVEKLQGVERVEVTLSADCSKGWPIALSRQSLVFANPGTQLIQLTVIVPPATPVQRGTVTIHATAVSPIWQEEDSYTVNVTILQYVNVDLWADAVRYEAEPGDTVGGKLYVNNSGNGEDTFLISLEDADKLGGTFKGWVFEESITVPPGFYGEVYFSLDVRKDLDVPTEGLMVTVVFKVESTKGKEMRTPTLKTLPVFVHFKGLTQVLEENWPTYVGIGAGAAIVIGIPAFFIIRRRRREDQEMQRTIDGVGRETETL